MPETTGIISCTQCGFHGRITLGANCPKCGDVAPIRHAEPTNPARKTIKFYRVNQYGVTREYIHEDHAGDARIIQQLTGQKTIDGRIRELLRDLTGSQIVWQEVIAP